MTPVCEACGITNTPDIKKHSFGERNSRIRTRLEIALFPVAFFFINEDSRTLSSISWIVWLYIYLSYITCLYSVRLRFFFFVCIQNRLSKAFISVFNIMKNDPLFTRLSSNSCYIPPFFVIVFSTVFAIETRLFLAALQSSSFSLIFRRFPPSPIFSPTPYTPCLPVHNPMTSPSP